MRKSPKGRGKTKAAKGRLGYMPKRLTARSRTLAEYRRKRDFARTAEPSGAEHAGTGGHSFVVQKHAASHLHYDFRLEVDGVLKSWAVAKGPSVDPAVKRLAIETEDHPLAYGDFEGTIPKGEYGGGTVMVWDRGTWEPIEDEHKGLKAGHLRFALYGAKMKGLWALVRMKPRPGERHPNWLLIKDKDAQAAPGDADKLLRKDRSAKTARSMAAIAGGADIRHSKPVPVKARSRRARGKAPKEVKPEPVKIVGGVRISHPDRMIYPKEHITKLDVARYYEAVAKVMLPHVADRPLALVRCPEGLNAPCFFQKHAGTGLPESIREARAGKDRVLVIESAEGLTSLVQRGVLEVHCWGCHLATVERPDLIVLDFDPDATVPWKQVAAAACGMRDLLKDLKLASFVKTTGGKGLHVVVPVAPALEWDAVKRFSRALAARFAARDPACYLVDMSKTKRKGRIFIDYLRNGRGATAVAPYSTRARPGGLIATPLSWEELEGGALPGDFTVATVPMRIAGKFEDPWRKIPSLHQKITPRMIAALTVETGA